MRVLVLFNEPVLPADDREAVSEEWVRTAAEDIERWLLAAGFDVGQVGIGRDVAALQPRLNAFQPDVVFNLFEGFGNEPQTEVAVAELLEKLRIPFTGSPSAALGLALHKHRAKRRLQQAGLPTPWFRVFDEPPSGDMSFPWPVIVKPACRDASEGIDQHSIASSPAELAARVTHVLAHYGAPVLVEQFIAGREFTVGLVAAPKLVALPITEMLHRPSPGVRWPILCYAAKWHPDSPEYEATDTQAAVPLPDELSRVLIDLARRTFKAIGCRDYARIDLRLTEAGEPMILEVNANPDMSPSACFAVALAVAGIDRGRLIVDLVRQAAARSFNPQPQA